MEVDGGKLTENGKHPLWGVEDAVGSDTKRFVGVLKTVDLHAKTCASRDFHGESVAQSVDNAIGSSFCLQFAKLYDRPDLVCVCLCACVCECMCVCV